MKQVPGGDFEAAYRTQAAFELACVMVSCVGKAELIAQKRASGRPQDLVDAAQPGKPKRDALCIADSRARR